jgi:hypothetical protein
VQGSGKSGGIATTVNAVLHGHIAPTGVVVVWAARVVWLLVAVLGGAAFGDALATHSRSTQLVGTAVLWVGWSIVACGLLVPSTVALTMTRSLVPLAAVCSALTFGGASALSATVAVALCLVMCALTASGEFGQTFVQASAYGDEDRFLLRPPVAYLAPSMVSWAVGGACLIGAPLALAAHAWALGGTLSAIAAFSVWFVGPRLHRLSRRWLVLVPAGIVIHDPVVLADTVMIATRNVAAASLAFADTEAADLTGPALGRAIEVTFTDLETVVFAPTRQVPAGRALHVRSVLLAPSRPGRVLAAAAARLNV